MRPNISPLKSSSIAFSLNLGHSCHGDTDFFDNDESILDMDTNEDEDDTDDEESKEEEEENTDEESKEEEETEDKSEEKDEESKEEGTDKESVPDTLLSSSPIKVIIITWLNNSTLDQSLKLTCSCKQDVASLYVSVSW
eukprot:15342653-Ditylum_brightwellii.AAC.1